MAFVLPAIEAIGELGAAGGAAAAGEAGAGAAAEGGGLFSAGRKVLSGLQFGAHVAHALAPPPPPPQQEQP